MLTRRAEPLSPLDCSSNLTFSLSPGWLFVETEDWRPDLEGVWIAPIETDDSESLEDTAVRCGRSLSSFLNADGWVYTNDAWMDPRTVPLEEWKTPSNGLTRRWRWVRRIYYDPTFAT